MKEKPESVCEKGLFIIGRGPCHSGCGSYTRVDLTISRERTIKGIMAASKSFQVDHIHHEVHTHLDITVGC